MGTTQTLPPPVRYPLADVIQWYGFDGAGYRPGVWPQERQSLFLEHLGEYVRGR